MKRILLKISLAVGDLCILAGASLLAYYLRFSLGFLPDRPIPPFELYLQFSSLVALIGFAMLYSSGMYQIRRRSFGIEDFFAIFRAVTLSALILMAMSFALRGIITHGELETYSRLILLISWLLSLVLVTLWRWGVAVCLQKLRNKGLGLKRVIIVGTEEVGRSFCRAIQHHPEFGYRSLGFVANGIPASPGDIEGLPVLGEVEALPDILRAETVNEVVLACTTIEQERVAKLIATCERLSVRFSMIPGFFEILTRQMSVQELGGIPIFQLEERIFQRWSRFVKRWMDIGFSLCLSVIFSPLLAIVAIGIKIGSRGPVFYRHARVGKGEKVFYMYKFRSMYSDAEEKRRDLEMAREPEEILLRVREDPRVTSFGRLLRRFSIDEVPQLINVLKGEMSLVGPRPHIPTEVARYKEWHRRKYDVLPGITGLTQVSGRKDLSLDEMVRLDIYYIENWSPLLDLKILFKTIPIVLTGRGAY